MTETKEKSCCVSKVCCPNVGKVDRVIRAAVGVGLISLVFVGPQTPFGWIGLLPLGSALVGWCGLYTLLGINTTNCCGSKSCCETKQEESTAPKTSCCGGGCHGGEKPAA